MFPLPRLAGEEPVIIEGWSQVIENLS
jgi:hypothetical protein